LPQDPEESELWRQASREGWDIGVEQAASIFQDALSRLNRDFQGMVLFQELHIQNMISAPYTETTELGVTGNQNTLRLNDKIIKITRPSVLNTVTNQWHPIIISE
jgi:defect-in-organelle-trafficking protein DotC